MCFGFRQWFWQDLSISGTIEVPLVFDYFDGVDHPLCCFGFLGQGE